jgi:hypothetical protein
MRKLIPVLALTAILALPAAAQNRGRFTLGGQFTALFTEQVAGGSGASQPGSGNCTCGYPGFGVRFTAGLVKRLGLDAEFDYLPGEGPSGAKASFAEILAGPRVLIGSGPVFHVYAYLRPGVLLVRGALGPENDFSLNPGLTFSFNLGRRWLGRMDVGELWPLESGCSNCIGPSGALPALNPQVSLGLAYRF